MGQSVICGSDKCIVSKLYSDQRKQSFIWNEEASSVAHVVRNCWVHHPCRRSSTGYFQFGCGDCGLTGVCYSMEISIACNITCFVSAVFASAIGTSLPSVWLICCRASRPHWWLLYSTLIRTGFPQSMHTISSDFFWSKALLLLLLLGHLRMPQLSVIWMCIVQCVQLNSLSSLFMRTFEKFACLRPHWVLHPLQLQYPAPHSS